MLGLCVNYLGRPHFRHRQPDSTGVLLVNLGTPDAPTTKAVRRYLAEFLWDRRVIELPRWLWWLILHGVILTLRSPRSAKAYAAVWTAEGSPLMCLTQSLTRRLGEHLGVERDPQRLQVRMAMRYGTPSVADVLRQMQESGLRRLLVLPLYPQYSATTTASVFDAVSNELRTWRFMPELRTIADYFMEPAYLDALAGSIRSHREEHGVADRLLFSFHGIPERYFRNGDPYFCQCQATARAVAERLGLAREDWALSFQSRVGREPWLKPYTDHTLAAWPGEGIRSVQVVCPGFAVDCLETIEEIDDENRERFLHAGGERFEYIPALNDSAPHAAALASLVMRHLQGWPPLDPAQAALGDDAALERRAARASAIAADAP